MSIEHCGLHGRYDTDYVEVCALCDEGECMKVLHKVVLREGASGEILKRSLCWNASETDIGGINQAEKDEHVTCQRCLSLMQKPEHYLHRNIVQEVP